MARALALLLTVLTGFTGLVYEISWQKVLATLLGSHSEAAVAVLGIFLGGLALGYFLFGLLSEYLASPALGGSQRSKLLAGYGLVEIAIGIYAFLFTAVFQAVARLSGALSPASELAAFGVDFALACALIGPPSVLMGGTIPLLTQGLARGVDDATRLHSRVYACNTAGAFLGALGGAFALIPALGLERSIALMGATNIAVGVAFLALALRAGAASTAPVAANERPSVSASDTAEASSGLGVWICAVLLSGFAMMTLQVAFNRIGALALGASYFTFAMVVATFVLCMAIGSFVVSWLPRIPRGVLPGTQWALVAYLLLAYPVLENAGYWCHLLRMRFTDGAADFYPFHLTLFGAFVVVLFVPLALSGALLPLLFHHLRNRCSDLGKVAGRIYGWNTVGSLVGAFVGGFLLLYWLDLHHTYRIALFALALSAALLTGRVIGSLRVPAFGLVAAVGCMLVLQPAWSSERLSAGLFRLESSAELLASGPDAFFAAHFASRPDNSVLFYDDDPTSSVAVINYRSFSDTYGRPGSRRPVRRASLSIVTNGKSDGNVPRDNPTMAMAGLLPALFSREPERAFVIGWGTGVTAGELAALDSIKEVVVAEISSAVLDAAPLFEKVNGGAFHSPKTRVLRGDAYRALMRAGGRYDVIVSEPSNPWVTGVEMLYSQEFLEHARGRLTRGGVFAQWMHRYEIDSASLELVFRTYLQVFDSVGVWMVNSGDLILLGFGDARPDLELDTLLRRWKDDGFDRAFRRSGIDSFAMLVAHELLPVGALRRSHLPGPSHTLMYPRLSYRAARAFFARDQAEIPGLRSRQVLLAGRRSSLARRYVEHFGAEQADSVLADVVDEACAFERRHCAVVVAQWLGVRGLPAHVERRLAHRPPARAAPLPEVSSGPAVASQAAPSPHSAVHRPDAQNMADDGFAFRP